MLDREQLPEVVLGSQEMIARFRSLGRPVAGVEIGLPAGLSIDVLPKKLLGAEGALFIIEQVLNGLYRLER